MRVAEVWRYPVKSLQGERLDEASVEADGLVGDRRLGVVDTETGLVLTARRAPELLLAAAAGPPGDVRLRLPDGRTLPADPGEADATLSQWLGRPVALVDARATPAARAEAFVDATDDDSEVMAWEMPAGRFVDAGPLLLLTTASLRAAAVAHPDGEWDVRRFRPNVLIDAEEAGEGFVEAGWTGREVRLGDGVVLRVLAPCSRCTMVTRPQPGLRRDLDVFRTLARVNQATFGVWASVVRTGVVRVGDAVAVDA